MGYWENTTYINSPSVESVLDELSTIFSREGMIVIPSLPTRERKHYEPMQYATALKNNLWGLAVFPGSENWVVIKSAPLELLGEKGPENGDMRFVSLCAGLKVPGFMYNVYDSGPEILVEADGAGKYGVTGYGYTDPLDYYGEKLDELFFEIQFRILPYQNILKDNGCDRQSAAISI